MAYRFTIPFYAFQLHLHGGGKLLLPLGKEMAVRMGQSLPAVARQYAQALQEQVLDKGELSELMNEYQEGDFLNGSLEVSFPSSGDGIAYPAFTLEFPFFYNTEDNGYWGILPTMQLEAFADGLPKLTERLKEAVLLDFKRKRRLQAVQDIVSAIWFDTVELKQKSIRLKAPTPRELEGMMKNQHVQLLPKVSQLLEIEQAASYGREEELSQFNKVLKSKFQRNVLLVGPSGVGKTALVWELSRQHRKQRSKNRFWESSASVMIKELMRDTGWQENLSLLCNELTDSSNLLFIRNLMDLFEVGKSEGNSVSIADYLRPFLSNGAITLITECTEEELAQIELKSPNYTNLFQKIVLEPPREPQLSQIILQKVKDTAAIQQLKISEEAIKEAIRLNQRFMPYSGLPGQPIRFMESLLLRRQAEARKEANINGNLGKQDVLVQFCEETGMPQFIIDPSLPMNAPELEKQFNNQLYGQETAVEKVIGVLAMVKAALTRKEAPIASFLFVGPTGVGKTELAKILAAFMFGSRERITRFDMSEYSNPYDVQRLIGGNAYSDGLLTSAVRKEPFSVLLFDEIEKADPTFYDLLLQLLSEGRLTDNQGKLTNFCSTIIIMTSNIGAQNLSDPIGWSKAPDKERIQQHFMAEVQKYFRPELYNRIDQVIPFAPLDPLTIRFVVEREIELLKKREGVRFRRMSFRIEEAVLDYLGEKGYDKKYGARQLQRTIREELVIPLAETLSSMDVDDQLDVAVRINKNALVIEAEADPLGLELLLEEYSKINHADHASSLRRRIEQLTEGHYFIQLLNELDFLERKKNSNGKAFWRNQIKAEKYTHLLDLRSRLENLLEKVEEIEIQLGLSCVDAGQYNIRWADELEQWEASFFNFKTELYSSTHPKADHTHLGIYGDNLPFILDFYLDLLNAQGYEYQGYSIWYREEGSSVLNESDTEKALERKARKGFVKQTFHSRSTLPLEAEQAGDKLWGVELAITGRCAHLFLEIEAGVQLWELDDEAWWFRVKVENDAFPTPTNLHRKEFYLSQPPRRTLSDGFIRDSIYKIGREFNKSELVSMVMEHLVNRFRYKINKEIT
jgi:ATP-dependent Clp protease ATP-binding subunit ClpA